jgi:hypothetical protein
MLYSNDNLMFGNQLRRPRRALRRDGWDRMHGILSQAVMENVGKLRAEDGCAATESGHCAQKNWDPFDRDKIHTWVSLDKTRHIGALAEDGLRTCQRQNSGVVQRLASMEMI